jgi:HK97 family phage major capsid protein
MNIAAMQRDLDALKAEITALYRKDGERTADEMATLKTKLDAAENLKLRIDRAQSDANVTAGIEALIPKPNTGLIVQPAAGLQVQQPSASRFRTLGQQWLASDGFKFCQRGDHRSAGAAWRSPSAELFDRRSLMATILDDTPPAGNGAALVVPQYQPGILETLYHPLVVADLIAPGTTDSNAVTYMRETLWTNAAAPVLAAGIKPESALAFAQVTDLVQKIAHWLPVTEEMLEDSAQIRAYIDARLRLGVETAEENQILNGTGIAPQLAGLLTRPGLAAPVVRDPTMSNADAIYLQITNIEATAMMPPDGIVMHPANWAAIAVMKNEGGDYVGNGPFSGPQPKTLWGLPVATTPVIPEGTAIVGCFRQAAQIFRKGGLRVEASNSHADYFIKNLVAIRAEERLALAVYRPGAFGLVTGLEKTAGGGVEG